MLHCSLPFLNASLTYQLISNFFGRKFIEHRKNAYDNMQNWPVLNDSVWYFKNIFRKLQNFNFLLFYLGLFPSQRIGYAIR